MFLIDLDMLIIKIKKILFNLFLIKKYGLESV
jgi:hypothetical protein